MRSRGRLRLAAALAGDSVPQPRIIPISASWRRYLVAQRPEVLSRQFRSHATLWCAVEEPELQQEWLVDILDGLDLFADDRSDGGAVI